MATTDTSDTTETDTTDTTTEETKTATTGYRFSGESGSYQAYNPSEWSTPEEVPFSEITITETDMRVKTAEFKSPYYVDLTKGRACCWIQRKHGENFGGVILSCEFDKDTGLYHYQCQDWNRLLVNKVYVILAGDKKVYDLVRDLLLKCYLSTDGISTIEMYDGCVEEVPTDDDPTESLTASNVSSGSASSDDEEDDDDSSNDKEKEAELAKYNVFRRTPEGLYDKLTARDLIFALCMVEGALLDIHMDENGVLRFDRYEKDSYRKARWFFVDKDIYDAKLKFDLKDLITQVVVKHPDQLDANATLYTSEKLVGVKLAAFFGVMGTVIDNPVKGSAGGNATNGDCITVSGKHSTYASCCSKYNGGSVPQGTVTRSYRNYCPMCGKSGYLQDTPKNPSRNRVVEGEISCWSKSSGSKSGGCGADYCICSGVEKDGTCRSRLTPGSSANLITRTGSSGSASNSSSGSSVSDSSSSSDSSNGTSDGDEDTSSAVSQGVVEDWTKNKLAARIAMSESIRKWFTFTLRVPGEYKELHTNSFCTFMMSEKFVLENLSTIAKKLNGKFTRYLGYEKNTYYIEGTTFKVDASGTCYTELKCNPFASDYSTYAKTQMQAEQALQSALGNGGNANGTDCTTDTGRTNKISCSGSPGAENLAVIGNSGANYAVIARQYNTPAEMLKAVHKRWSYLTYSDNNHPSGTTAGCPQKQFAQSKMSMNCADSAWLMKCIFDCAGYENYIIHVPGHYYNKVKWNGRYYGADLCYWGSSANELSRM